MLSPHRSSAAFDSSDLACVDIDSGLSVQKFLEHPLAVSAAWVYTTASHQPDEGKHRFRVIFRLAETMTDASLYKAVTTLLSRALGGDKSCTDACRLYYGNDKAECPLWQPKAFLSQDIIEDAYKEAAAARMRPDSSSDHFDENTLLTAIYALESVLEPTAEGDRDRFVRITAACAAGGDRLFPAWSDWASRGHHGSGGNSRRVGNEKFFHGFSGSSLGTLFFMASEDDPNWRAGIPEELREERSNNNLGIFGSGFAGYGHEDFLGDPNEPSLIYEPIQHTQNLFAEDPQPWRMIATVAPAQDDVDLDDTGEVDSEFTEQDIFDTPSDADPEAIPPQPRSKGGDQEDQIESIKNRLDRLYPRLRRNEMTQELVYGPNDDPQPIPDISTAYVRISRGLTKVLSKTTVYDTAQVLGHERRFNPVTDFLERVLKSAEPCPYFDRLASELLGTSDDDIQNPRMPDGSRLADVILKRFLIGAVARIRTPGCVHDWMPILVGGQNSGKSAFYKYLTPPDPRNPGSYPWQSTIQQGIDYIKDRPHALHAGWICTIDEAERYFSRRHVEVLKNLVSVSTDRSARKYENEKSFKRSFVLCGATNNVDFLTDPTGNRRFMPIIVEGKVPSPQNPSLKIIDLDRLKRDRDSIWAAAYRAYLDNPVHTFSSFELSHVSSYTASFNKDTPIEEKLVRELEKQRSGHWVDPAGNTRSYVILSDVFDWLCIPIDRQGVTTPITDSLKRLGYTSKKIRVHTALSTQATQKRVWLAPLQK